MNDHTANVFAIAHVLIALIDLIEGVGTSDHSVEVELSLAVELGKTRNVGTRIGRAELGTNDLLLAQREINHWDVVTGFQPWVDIRDNNTATL